MFRFLQFSIFFLTFLLNAQEQESFYFDSNRFELQKSEILKLNNWISANSKVKIVAINGYADEDGSVGFNDTLAQKRVNFVFKEIGNKVAIRSDFKTRSYGKQHQQSNDKSKNRRVTVYFIEEKDLHREDEILGIKPIEKPPVQKPKRIFPEIIQIKNPNGSVSEYELNREFMQKIDESKPGEKLKIDNLNFHLNTFAIVNESRGKLYELLLVMQQNPNLEINIQGHLCCMLKDRNNLSTQRAKAIQQFLIFNGIEKSRLSYQGLGSSQAIFTLPEKNEEERAANRRVEIEIIKN